MSREKGMLVTCDICGATVMLKTTGDGEADGGYSRWNKFERAPEGWRCKVEVDKKCLDTCPKCTAKYDELYERLISEFTGNPIVREEKRGE